MILIMSNSSTPISGYGFVCKVDLDTDEFLNQDLSDTQRGSGDNWFEEDSNAAQMNHQTYRRFSASFSDPATRTPIGELANLCIFREIPSAPSPFTTPFNPAFKGPLPDSPRTDLIKSEQKQGIPVIFDGYDSDLYDSDQESKSLLNRMQSTQAQASDSEPETILDFLMQLNKTLKAKSTSL